MTPIISWNVNGLRAVYRKGNLEEVFRMKPDILCLQETKSRPEQLPNEVREPKGYHSYFHSPMEKGYSGVAIYSKEKPIKVSYGLPMKAMDPVRSHARAKDTSPMDLGEATSNGVDQEGRLITVEYQGLTLVNCYFPNGGGPEERLRYKLDFYEYFLKYINKLHMKQPNILFCGDLNVAHTEIDIARPKENEKHVGFLPIERAWVDKLIKHGWVDVFRHFHPNTKEVYTYWDLKSFARERNVGWRIDYFFASPAMLKKIKSMQILDGILGSDHCPVELIVD